MAGSIPTVELNLMDGLRRKVDPKEMAGLTPTVGSKLMAERISMVDPKVPAKESVSFLGSREVTLVQGLPKCCPRSSVGPACLTRRLPELFLPWMYQNPQRTMSNPGNALSYSSEASSAFHLGHLGYLGQSELHKRTRRQNQDLS